MREFGLSLGGGDDPKAKDYAVLLESIKGRSNVQLLQTVMLRSLRQAMYSPDNVGHFGLAYEGYTHFTSPIRRYPDLAMHRAIKYQLAKEQGNQKERWTPTGGWHSEYEDMLQLGEHCSMTERRADEALQAVFAPRRVRGLWHPAAGGAGPGRAGRAGQRHLPARAVRRYGAVF